MWFVHRVRFVVETKEQGLFFTINYLSSMKEP